MNYEYFDCRHHVSPDRHDNVKSHARKLHVFDEIENSARFILHANVNGPHMTDDEMTHRRLTKKKKQHNFPFAISSSMEMRACALIPAVVNMQSECECIMQSTISKLQKTFVVVVPVRIPDMYVLGRNSGNGDDVYHRTQFIHILNRS